MVIGHMLTQISQSITRVLTPTNEPVCHNECGSGTNRGNGCSIRVKLSDGIQQVWLAKMLLPTVASRQNEHSHIAWINLCKSARGLNHNSTHRLDRVHRMSYGFHSIPAMPPKFRDRVRGLPICESGKDKQVNSSFSIFSLITLLIHVGIGAFASS